MSDRSAGALIRVIALSAVVLVALGGVALSVLGGADAPPQVSDRGADAAEAPAPPAAPAEGAAVPVTEDAAPPGGYTVSMSPVGDVRFDRVPQRAVTLDAHYEDILTALDRESRLVATGYQGNYYDGFYAQIPGLEVSLDRAALPQIGVGLDKETLYALKADVHHIDPKRLLRMNGWGPEDIEEIARNVGPFFGNRFSRENAAPDDEPYTFYTTWALSERVGAVYRRAAPIVALQAIYDEMVARLQAKLPPVEARPKVGLVMYGNGRFTPFALSREGFATAQYRALGAQDAFAEILEQTYGDGGRVGPGLDMEGLLAIDPDVLIMPFAIYESSKARFEGLTALKDDPLGSRLKAMAAGHVYPGGTPLQGPIYLLFQTEMAAKQIYPELFGAFRPDGIYPPGEQLFDRQAVAKALGIRP